MVMLTIFTSLIALMVVSAMLRGYVLSVLWGWFIVPTFGLPALSIPVAIGIALILVFTTHQTGLKKDDQTFSERVGNVIINPLMVLLIGWIVTLFI